MALNIYLMGTSNNSIKPMMASCEGAKKRSLQPSK